MEWMNVGENVRKLGMKQHRITTIATESTKFMCIAVRLSLFCVYLIVVHTMLYQFPELNHPIKFQLIDFGNALTRITHVTTTT